MAPQVNNPTPCLFLGRWDVGMYFFFHPFQSVCFISEFALYLFVLRQWLKCPLAFSFCFPRLLSAKSVTDAIATDSAAGILFVENISITKLSIISNLNMYFWKYMYFVVYLFFQFHRESWADVKKDNEPRFGNKEMPVSSEFASVENQLKACMIFEYICIICASPFLGLPMTLRWKFLIWLRSRKAHGIFKTNWKAWQ